MRTESELPKKQRKAFFQARLHERTKHLSAHLSESLRKKMKQRAIPLRTKDTVVVMRGQFKKRQAKISKIDHKKMRVYLEGLTRKKAGGKEIALWVKPSNVMVLELTERKSPSAPKATMKEKAEVKA